MFNIIDRRGLWWYFNLPGNLPCYKTGAAPAYSAYHFCNSGQFKIDNQRLTETAFVLHIHSSACFSLA